MEIIFVHVAMPTLVSRAVQHKGFTLLVLTIKCLHHMHFKGYISEYLLYGFMHSAR